jgi:uncharacterized Rmd1/YagE family protein
MSVLYGPCLGIGLNVWSIGIEGVAVLGRKSQDSSHFIMQAYDVAETLKLKDIDRLFTQTAKSQSSSRLVYEEGEGYFFIYRFGSVVFFNIRPERQREIIEKIRMLIGGRPDVIISDEFAVDVKPGAKHSVGFEGMTLSEISLVCIDLMALILALSTALEYFENRVNDMLKRTGDIGQSLKDNGRLKRGSGEIKRFIGQCIVAKQQLVASLYILDKPDETWNDQILDNLYREAADMFELRERYKTLDYKLRMIQENLELIATLLQYRHANFLEWAIIILIAAEIVLFLF